MLQYAQDNSKYNYCVYYNYYIDEGNQFGD